MARTTVTWLLLLFVVLMKNGVEDVTGLSVEDLPEYEILQFAYKENVTSARSNNKPQRVQPLQQTPRPQPVKKPQQTPKPQSAKPQQTQKPQQTSKPQQIKKPQEVQEVVEVEIPIQQPQPVQQAESTPLPPTQTQKPQPQTNGPCTCKYGVCTCCSGPVLDLIRQKACMKVVYTPEDFAFDFSMMLNNRVMYTNRISGKNPPPACISLPRLDSFRLCTKFSNVYFVGRNLHLCLNLEGRWNSYELFKYSFDCLKMGSEGVHFLKPEDGGYPSGIVGGLDAIIDAGDDIEDYDENVVRSAKANILRMIRDKEALKH